MNRTCVAPSVPRDAVRVLCIALRAVCPAAATSVAKIQSMGAVPLGRDTAHVRTLRPNQPPEPALLEAVGGPSGNAAYRERRREERPVELETAEQQRRVELDVRPDPPAGLVLLKELESLRLDGAGELVEAHVARAREPPRRSGREHVGARIANLV